MIDVLPRLPETPHAASDFGGPVRRTVLIIAAAFPPDPLSGAARPGRFAKYLPQFGYDPIVICQGSQAQAASSETVRRVPRTQPGHGVRLLAGAGHYTQRFLLPYDDRLPWAAHAMAEAERVVAERSVDVVLSTAPPLATHLAALRLKWKHGIPWVADFRDPLLGNPFRSRKWIFPYDALMERLLFHQADALIANTDTVDEMWKKRHPAHAHKVSVLWNGFDPEDRVQPAPSIAGGRRVLTHVGSLYGGRHPGRLLSSVVRLIQRGTLSADGVRIRLIGSCDEYCIAVNQQAVDTLRAWDCLECDRKQVPQDVARKAASEADYLLLLDMNEHDADLQVPAKVFEYIQFGRPILVFTRRDSPTDRILKNSGVPCRSVYHGADDAEVDRQVRDLFRLPTEPVQPSAWFEEQFNGWNQVRALAGILDHAMTTRRSARVYRTQGN